MRGGRRCSGGGRAYADTQGNFIDRAPWREAVTYRDTWPHEYVLTEKDDQRELLAAICTRFRGRGRRRLSILPHEQHVPVRR